MKKTFVLSLFLIFMLACVVTPPEGFLPPTPTICVECVQATICAENATNDSCPSNAAPTLVDSLPTLIPAIQEPTPTAVETEILLPTETSTEAATNTIEAPLTVTSTIVSTSTLTPSRTLTATRTATSTKTETPSPTASRTPTNTATPQLGSWVYKSQTGSPKYATNFAHPELGCKWSGVAGQIFGPGGAPQENVVVVITGDANGVPIDLLGFSGSAVKYGVLAYEMEFPAGPVKTTGTLRIQLFDLEAKELTAAIPFDTFTDCDKNLVVFNFTLTN
ncbi:MAG: hypothetical protein WCG34_05370 [Leptolinea sp.]